LTDKLLTTFKQKIKGYRLIPDRSGCFELTVNGQLIYSKLATGSFPDEKAMIAAVKKHSP
jgi:selenoprotein W-related protein